MGIGPQPTRRHAVLSAVAGGLLATLVATLALAGADPGAGARERGSGQLRPSPANAFDDRARIFRDGCFIQIGETRQGECAYGERSSDTTVVLFADSHGEPYFPALERLANRRGWRLVALAKSFCSPAAIRQLHPFRDGTFRDCHEWRRYAIRRILERERPELVVIAGSAYIMPAANGRELSGPRAKRVMARGFADTIERVRAGGAEVAITTDAPKAPFKIPECLQRHRPNWHACDFRAPKRGRAIAKRAARLAGATTLVDTIRVICTRRGCRAVIDDVIVYRDRGHLTATFGGTLRPLFARRLAPIG